MKQRSWIIEINSKPNKIEKLLQILGIKLITICETRCVEAASLEEAIRKIGCNPKKWNIKVQEIKQVFSNPVGTLCYTSTTP